MSKGLLQNFQIEKETDNLKDRPAPHCGESPIPASSLPAVAVLRPSLLGMMMIMMMIYIMMKCVLVCVSRKMITPYPPETPARLCRPALVYDDAD